MRFGETTWVLFQHVKKLPRFCTAMNWMGGSYDQISCVFLAPRIESEQAAPGLVVGMDAQHSVSERDAGKVGRQPRRAEKGCGRAGKGWTRDRFLGE